MADGEGTLIASEPVLLIPTAIRIWTAPGAELILGEYLGAKKIVWIAGTLAGDPAGGLIDNVRLLREAGHRAGAEYLRQPPTSITRPCRTISPG